MYLKSNGGTVLFTEYEKTTDLCPRSQSFLGDLLVKFLLEQFADPQKIDIHRVCEATLVLFPALTHEPSIIEGIVSIMS